MRRLLLLLLLVLMPSVCGAAVALDAAGTSASASTVLSPFDFTGVTVGAGANRALVAQINFSLETVGSVTVTWDQGGTNQAMGQIVCANGAGAVGRSCLYGLVAPTSGNKTLRVTWTGTTDIIVDAVAWTGVDQTGGTTSFAHSTSATGNSVAPSVTVTSASGNATMECSTTDLGNYSASTQTQVYIDNTPTSISGAGSRATGAATVTHGWTLNLAGNWVSVGVDIVAGGGAAPVTTPSRTLQGVGT